MNSQITLEGDLIRLEPLELRHLDALVAAANVERSIYEWSIVPPSVEQMREYIETAIAWREAGTAIPFVSVRKRDGVVLGSTRFFEIEEWRWPKGHERHGRSLPDACEIGYTWLRSDALRTGANSEAKLLMLTHAFDQWGALRVCFHTDIRNERSRRAIERLGARFEGVLRAHRIAADGSPRDSCRYSILLHEWPLLKRHALAEQSRIAQK
ncbi:MAG: GNAT family N-acetyltransferase [Candidatus Eremiobacteraeota bacterium]|nr:GNAT family N-acetyltransferase [Candidatus Eremiobacteraeota bacterium]